MSLLILVLMIFQEGLGFPARRLLPKTVSKLLKQKKLRQAIIAKAVKKQETNPTFPPTTTSNIISANTGDGVFINNHSNNNLVQNNIIGLNNVLAPLGNKQDGVSIENRSDNNVIGGPLTQNGNIIAYNKKGVVVGNDKCDLSIENSILSNSIFGNKCIGIDLANDGITPNHKASPSVGPNNFQNFPVLNKALLQAGTLTLKGTLTSVPSNNFLIQFFNNIKKDEEGKTLIGQLTVSTNALGEVSFSASFPAVAAGTFITATATRINANEISTDTSEFSRPIEVKKCK